MTIKPIDMQTSIGQMHEVARTQHAHNESVIEQMHHLDKEASDKASEIDSHLDEAEKAQHLANRLDDHERQGRGRQGKKGKFHDLPEKEKKNIEIVENGNLGRIIDVKK